MTDLRWAERCCAFLTCSDMRFAFARTSAGEAPASASHLIDHPTRLWMSSAGDRHSEQQYYVSLFCTVEQQY